MTHERGAIPRLSERGAVWRHTLDLLPLGIALLDADSSLTLWANRALTRMIEGGTGTHDVLGCTPPEFLPGLQRDTWNDVCARIVARGEPGRPCAPARLQFVDLSTRNIAYWDWALQLVDEGHPAKHLLLTVQSVGDTVMNERLLLSATRQAERARQRAEAHARLAQLLNASLTTPDLLRVVTEQAARYCDSPYAAVLLLDPDDGEFHLAHAIGVQTPVVGGKIGTPVISEPRVATGNTALRVVSSQVGTLVLADGQRPGHVVSSPIQQGDRTYGLLEVYFTGARRPPDGSKELLGGFADQTATALHRAELYEQLAVRRRQLQSILDHAPVSILYLDTAGIIVAVNADAARNFGRTAREMTAHRFTEFLSALPEGLFGNVRNGEPFHASHFVYDSPTQGEIVCDLSLVPVRDETHSVVGVLLLSFEVTELVKARQDADAARQSAESALEDARQAHRQMLQMEKMRAIGELASGVAHDFNNALMAILGYTELAEDSTDDQESLKQYLSIIRKAAEDATTTVQRLQRFARQRSAAFGVLTDVNSIVEDVLQMTRPVWRDRAHKEGREYRIRKDLHETSKVMVEPSGLREVLVNIIQNALHAMPTGGELKLATRQRNDKEIEIEVADTGVGMSPEVAARIFDPFYTTRGVEGTGLGLAVSWTIIQKHGGTIDFETIPNKGTRFFLRLPVATEEAVMATTERAPSQPLPPNAARLLVVDDEPLVASVLNSILSRHGHRVTVTHSAEEALHHLESETGYELVLTDHGMANMTGLQLVAEVKKQWPHIPVVLLTGWGETILETHVTETRPDAILGKPINQADLLDVIARTLRETSEHKAQEAASPQSDALAPERAADD